MAHLIEMWNDYADRLIEAEYWNSAYFAKDPLKHYIDPIYSRGGPRHA